MSCCKSEPKHVTANAEASAQATRASASEPAKGAASECCQRQTRQKSKECGCKS